MEIEEADGVYTNEVNKANDFFLKGIREKKDKKRLASDYKERLRLAREKYNKTVKKILAHQKNKKKEEKKEEKKDEENKKKEYKRPYFSDLKIRLKIFYFRFTIRLKIIKERLIPSDLSLFYKKIRTSLKHQIKDSKDKFSRMKYIASSYFQKLFERYKKRVSEIYDKSKARLLKSLTFIRSKLKKKEEKKDESLPSDSSQNPPAEPK